MLVTTKSVGVVKGSKIYCRSLLVYSPALRVSLDTAIVSSRIKDYASHVHKVDTLTRLHSMFASSARQASIATL